MLPPPTIQIRVAEKKRRGRVVIVVQFEYIDSSKRGERVRIIKEEDIDSLGVGLFALLEDMAYRRIIVSFANASFMSSAMIGKFITLDKKVKRKKLDRGAEDSMLILCSIPPEIYEVFAITRMNRLFNIQENEDKALEQFGPSQPVSSEEIR